MINDLMYIELKTGYSDDGPAWIGYVKTSKTKSTIILMTMLFKNIMVAIQIIQILKMVMSTGSPV